MTDCYICGHPILEGQKRIRSANPQSFHREEHLNPADHLPTQLAVKRVPPTPGQEAELNKLLESIGKGLSELRRDNC